MAPRRGRKKRGKRAGAFKKGSLAAKIAGKKGGRKRRRSGRR